MTLILVSGDAPHLSLQLAMAAAQQDISRVVDLSGEGLLPPANRFDVIHELETRWPPLQERLAGWFELLQLDTWRAHQLPLIPGLEDVLRSLMLLDRLKAADGQRLVVLLPACGQAQRFLQGLTSSPDLVDQLYTPLIERLGQLKDSISRLEGFLNLRLPDRSSLELPASLLQDLDELHAWLHDPSRCELQLALPASLADQPLLAQRICGFYLTGVQVSRLWLDGPLEPAVRTALQEQWQPSHLLHTEQPHAFETESAAWFDQPWQGETAISHGQDDDGTAVVSVLLPGVQRDQLQVQRIGNSLQVRLGSLRRSYALPASCRDRAPSGARVAGRRLEVRFR